MTVVVRAVLISQFLTGIIVVAFPLGNQETVDALNAAKASIVNPSPPTIDVDRARFDKDLNADKKTQYSFIQKALVNLLQPKPIVDTLREQDKYGNDGEGFSKLGRGVVGGVMSLTNLLSVAVDIPFEALKTVTRKATASLNNLGNKLVGL